MRPQDESSVSALLEQIAEATRLAIQAEQALLMSDPTAGELQTAAETAHYQVLGRICGLTEGEANQVEPAFTELENRLLRTSAARNGNEPPRRSTHQYKRSQGIRDPR